MGSGGGNAIGYTIDGMGRRVGRERYVSGQLQQDRRYLYGEGHRLVAVYDGSGTLLQQFVYATRGHVPDLMINAQTGKVYRLITDQLGSVRIVADLSAASASAARVQEITYDAWGNATVVFGSSFEQPFGFAGGLWDRDSGLVHFGARDYDPETARWLQKDPILFGGGDTNMYAYVGNDPVNWIDPSGLAPGDEYPSSWDAATAALREAWQRSRTDEHYLMWESGGLLYRNWNGSYSYTPAVVGFSAHVDVWQAMDSCIGNPFAEIVGDYHTHSFFDPQGLSTMENFSPVDLEEIGRDYLEGGVSDYTAFLGTPQGRMRMYQPGSDIAFATQPGYLGR